MERQDATLRKGFYAFALPHDILSTLKPDDESAPSGGHHGAPPPSQRASDDVRSEADSAAGSTTCSTCRVSFPDTAEQRQHVKSDWHRYNLKQKLRGQDATDESTFDRLIGELDESLSGSDSASSDDDDAGATSHDDSLAQLLKKQAKVTVAAKGDDEEAAVAPQHRRGTPFVWFVSSALPPDHRLGVYRALFTHEELQKPNLATCLISKQLQPVDVRKLPKQQANDSVPADAPGPTIFLCMIGGGHFAAMVVALTPKLERKAQGATERQAIVVAHKTFHRYTTRRKQGGAQSANDAAKGNAHSAGAAIRRANEIALEMEVRSLLEVWAEMLAKCQLLFIRATGATNRRTLFGPYEKQVLTSRDPRIRSLPFSTRRATQSELMRAFVELTRAKVEAVETAMPVAESSGTAVKPASAPKITPAKPSKEEEEALLHTSQLQALIKRSKAPALLKYISSNSLFPDFRFHPASSAANRHASTPLHLAASSNLPVMITTLLTKAGADPGTLNGDAKVAFELAGDRATRDAFRVARSELGEGKWDWEKSHVPSPMSREEAESREKTQQVETQKEEGLRRKAELERLEKTGAGANGAKTSGKTVPALEVTAADRREQESRGLTPEQKQKLERERRARAAEERMRRMAGGQ